MIVLKHPEAFAASLLILVPAAALLHLMYPRIYSKNCTYRHALVGVVSRRLASLRRKKRITSLALKLAMAVTLSLAISQPYLVTQEQVCIESRQVSELRFNTRPALVVILDTSGSMGEGAKLDAAKKAIAIFLEKLSPEIDVGFIDFAHWVKQAVAPAMNRSQVLDAVETARAEGGTMYTFPLKTALNWLKPYRDLNASVSVVFVSDGMPGDLLEYRGLLRSFEELKIPIYTVFIGFENEGISEMKRIASATGGEAFVAKTVDSLAEVLNSALEKAAQSIQEVEVSTKVTKTMNVYRPLADVLLALLAFLYLLYRFIAYRSTGVSF
jgi:Ca-activated chloride channel family protein